MTEQVQIPPEDVAMAAELLATALGAQGLAWNGAGHLTCGEVDRIAEALILLGRREAAVELIHGHATDEEEEGDGHFLVTDEETAKVYIDEMIQKEA